MDLPRALAPWASLLDLFPVELALALGPLVQRLDLLAPARTPRTHPGAAEPDGFDGLSRRGSYERLLLTEWLLADEAPDEFIRRAAMGEHAFLQIARNEPARTRTAVILFDSGPSQWGTPRIAHIAALVVLARRAQGAGARLVWGILQAVETVRGDTVTPETVRRMLAARTGREATEGDLRAWQESLTAASGPFTSGSNSSRDTGDTDDLWIVGGDRLAPLLAAAGMARARLLEIRDVCEPEARRLEATVWDQGRPLAGGIVLDLPDDAVCTRLIRDPFASASASAVPLRAGLVPHSNLLFAQNGTKLLARADASNRLIAYPIPNSVRAPAGRPKIYSLQGNGPIIAANRIGKSLIAVSIETVNGNRALHLESLNGKIRLLTEGNYTSEMLTEQRIHGGPTDTTSATSVTETPLLPCFAVPETPSDLLTLTPGGTLWRLHYEAGKYAAKVEALEVEALGAFPGSVACICRLNDRRVVITQHASGEQSFLELPSTGHRSFFGTGGNANAVGLFTYETEPGMWVVQHKEGPVLLLPPKESEVIGTAFLPPPTPTDAPPTEPPAAEPPAAEPPPALVVIDADRRGISLLARDATFALPRTASPIRTATISPYFPQIAYATAAGEVFVYSLAHRELLYRSVVDEGAG